MLCDEEFSLQTGSNDPQDEAMAEAASVLVGLHSVPCSGVWSGEINEKASLPTGDACGAVVFSPGSSVDGCEKPGRLQAGQEVVIPMQWVSAQQLRGRIEGFSSSGDHMLVSLEQVLKVPVKGRMCVDDFEAMTPNNHVTPNNGQCADAEWMHYPYYGKSDSALYIDGRAFPSNTSIQNQVFESLGASPVGQVDRVHLAYPDIGKREEDEVSMLEEEGRLGCPPMDNPPQARKDKRRSLKSRFRARRVCVTEDGGKVAENFKVNYREVVKTVRDAVYWLKRAWWVIKRGKAASYFALERLVQSVQGPMKVKNTYSCKRQECLRMIVWCFVLGPDKLKKRWNLSDPDMPLDDGLLYSSKKVGGLAGLADEFRKWERREGYVDCRQDRERGAMVQEDEFVISQFEARFGLIECD